MRLRRLNLVCYTVCIVCIITAVVFSLVLIWGEVADEIAWKSYLTLIVFFVGSLLTMSVNRLLEPSSENDRSAMGR